MKHLSKRRKRDRHVISLVVASERERAKNLQLACCLERGITQVILIDKQHPVWGKRCSGVEGKCVEIIQSQTRFTNIAFSRITWKGRP